MKDTDEELMTLVAAGDLEKLKTLFERHHLHVFNFLYKMSGDRMLSEDITQEVFYKLMKYRTSYKQGKFVSWMFTITRNSLSSHYKKAKTRFADLESVAHKLSDNETETREDYSFLQKALDKLSDTDKEILVLNRIQGIKYQELAEIMDASPGAIKTKVSRALTKLKKIYFENTTI